MKSITVLITLIALSFPTLLAAKVWQQTFTVEYALGDGDSKTTARELALAQIKIKASNKAGSYIHTTSTLVNDQLSENIQVIGASMVMLSGIKEHLTTKNNRITLFVTALARIDESELKRRIAAMQRDKAKAKQITQLNKDNEMLSVELRTIRSLLAKKHSSSTEVASILNRQSTLLKRFEHNAAAVKRVFTQGTLFQMAQTSSAKLERVKAQLETEFFGALMQTQVKAEIVSVIDNERDFTVLVNVSWTMPKSLSFNTLIKHLSGRNFNKDKLSKTEDLTLDSNKNVGGKGKTTLSESLFNYLGEQHVHIEIKLGSKKFNVPLFWSRKGGSFSSCKSASSSYNDFIKSNGLLCLTLMQDSHKALHGIGYKQDENPIKFKLTKKEVRTITTIETKIVRG
ncbi:hypothetical protein A9Q81_08470 [Gammaproteobacteria bacterium 42_54_T18]|nr:hypothetical protein A9Q81_08470 [Gammaproteobacteria bacterium 42_54_T18]